MNEEQPIIELLPPLDGKCKILVYTLRIAFTAVPILMGVFVWIEFGWMYGALLWMTAVFAGLIVLSKLKLTYIPINQHELPHSATAILKWYVAKELCRYKKIRQNGDQ